MEIVLLARMIEIYHGSLSAIETNKLLTSVLRDKALVEFDAGDGWVLSEAGENLLQSAGYLVERAGKRDNF